MTQLWGPVEGAQSVGSQGGIRWRKELGRRHLQEHSGGRDGQDRCGADKQTDSGSFWRGRLWDFLPDWGWRGLKREQGEMSGSEALDENFWKEDSSEWKMSWGERQPVTEACEPTALPLSPTALSALYFEHPLTHLFSQLWALETGLGPRHHVASQPGPGESSSHSVFVEMGDSRGAQRGWADTWWMRSTEKFSA